MKVEFSTIIPSSKKSIPKRRNKIVLFFFTLLSVTVQAVHRTQFDKWWVTETIVLQFYMINPSSLRNTIMRYILTPKKILIPSCQNSIYTHKEISEYLNTSNTTYLLTDNQIRFLNHFFSGLCHASNAEEARPAIGR